MNDKLKEYIRQFDGDASISANGNRVEVEITVSGEKLAAGYIITVDDDYNSQLENIVIGSFEKKLKRMGLK